ncbi:hypothetical protein C5B85_11850 [Pseudoclavibacter sp. AY1F1]|uniref:hypothetical protein n=1 Tax=Pseudoclavibacter sp. AY1F1 TaxID=2080583 RepID=UPI000CE7E824|nr:hypothetical protein [Pseudoclavibacter sp. AY1F1]PPF43834.1 hypothetical protein C5B85_11850 [Pseudoclavibacter sp. AY1F1]
MSDSNQVPGDKPKLPEEGSTPPQYEAPAAYTPPAESVDYSAPSASGTDYTPPSVSGTDYTPPTASGSVSYTPPSEPAATPSAAPYGQAPTAGEAAAGAAPAYGAPQTQGQAPGYGAPQGYATPGYPAQSTAPKRTLSIVALVLGGAGVIFCLLPILGLPLGIAGLICAILAKTREPQAGALRTAGFWVSIGAIVLNVVLVVFSIITFMAAFNDMGYGGY